MSIFSVGGSSPSEGFELKSTRFDVGGQGRLMWTPSVEGNRRTWTFSCWAKRGSWNTVAQCLFSANNQKFNFEFTGTEDLLLNNYAPPYGNELIRTNAKYRDPSAWYHIVGIWDTTNATANDRIRLWVNGEQVTSFQLRTNPVQNLEGEINTTTVHYIGARSNNDKWFDGYMAECYFIDGATLDASYFGETNVATNQWQPKNPTDIKPTLTFGTNGFYLPFSNDVLAASFTDSTEGRSIVVQGNTHTDTAIKKFGTASAQFDGTGDALSITGTPVGAGTGNWTVECWVYVQGSNSSKYLWDMRNSSFPHGGSPSAPYIYFDSSASAITGLNCGKSDGTSFSTGTISVANDAWHHIAAVRNNGVYTTYIDGTSVGTPAADTASLSASEDWMIAGRYSDADYITGYVDEFRVSDSARYIANFIAPAAAFTNDSNTKLLMHMDGANDGTVFTDSSTVAKHTITAVGNTTNQRVSPVPIQRYTDATGGSHFIGPKIGTGCYANAKGGNDEWLEVADSADWTFGTGDFTLEGWVNLDKKTEQTLFSQYASASSRWYLTIDNRDAQQEIAFYHYGAGTSIAAVGVWPGVHQWVHLAFVRASGVIKIYVDGVSQTLATNTNASANLTDIAAVLQIGAYNDGQRVKGYLDELRVSNSARWTADFTPETAAYTTDANTKLLLHCDGAMGSTSFPDSSNLTRSAISIGGNTHTDTSQKKIGTASAQFDGTGDYLVLPSDWGKYLIGGSGDWTVEAWLYWSGSSDAIFFEQGDSADRAAQFYIQADGDIQIYLSTSGSSWDFNQVSGSTLSANTWTHVALVKSGSGIYLFKDGVLDVNINGDTQAVINKSDYVFNIGAYMNSSNVYSSSWPGYMDEIRFSGVARYTSTFTAFGQGGGTISSPTAFNVDDDTRLLMHMDGTDGGTTFPDSVTGHPVKAQGTSMIIAPKIGLGCYRNNGSGNGLAAVGSGTNGSDPKLQFGLGDWTMEAWVTLDDITTNNQQFITKRWTTYSGDLVLWWSSTQGLRLEYENNNLNQGSTSGWANNTWRHIAVVKNGSALNIYVDGTSVANTTTSIDFDAQAPTYFASYGNSSGHSSSGAQAGFMDEVRISRKAEYTGTFIPPTTAFTDDKDTTLLLHCDGGGNIEDDVPTAAGQGTYARNVSTNAIFYGADGIPTNKSLISFDGSGDKLTVAASSDFNFGTNPFTIEGWLYADTLDGGGQAEACTMLSSGTLATADNQWRAAIWSIGSVDRLSFAIYETAGGGGWPIHMYPNTFEPPVAGRWYHWAVTRSGNTWSMWTNGICTADDVDSLNWNMGANDIIAGYVNAWSNNYYLDGKQDQIRVSDNVRYTGTYTQPSAAFSSDSDTSLLLHLDGANDGTTFTDSSSGTHTVTVTGNIVTKTGVKKFGTASGYFNGGSTNRLTVADHADFQFGTGAFTIEAWVYPVSAGGSVENMIVAKGTSTAYWMLRHEENNTQGRVRWYASDNSATVADIKVDLYATRWAYDTWHHIAVTSDGTTHTLLVDGNCVGACTARLANWDYSGNPIVIGNNPTFGQTAYGYIDEVRISKGVSRYSAGRYTIPTEPFTTDANTKLLVQSDFSEGGLGADHSGNYNYFTPTNLTADDMMLDSPMNNFATGNPLFRSLVPVANQTYSEGNLKLSSSGAYSYAFGVSNMAPLTGKWYCEFAGITDAQVSLGVWKLSDLTPASYYNATTLYRWFGSNGVVYNESSVAAQTYSTFGVGDVIGIALDLDNNKVFFAKNNTWQGSSDPAAGTNPAATDITDEWLFGIAPASGSADSAIFNFGQDSSFAGALTAQGNQDGNDKGDFYYTPPSGYLALCTDNLPAPSITLPTDHFNSILWTGDGTSPRSFTGVGFTPDFTWTKNRTTGVSHMLYDTVRGAGSTKSLESNATLAEGGGNQATYGYLSAFGSDGFTTTDGSGSPNYYFNENTKNFVAWNWKAGGTAVSNTDGTITSSVSANPTAGFSIVSYTGTDVAGATVGHGLSQAPELWIVKRLATADWWGVGATRGINATKYLQLNTTTAATTHTTVWNDTAPTASVFSLGTADAVNYTEAYIAYCFHSVEGYSRVGSYIGNSSTDGTFVYCGFKPAYIMQKNIGTSVDNWNIWDVKRDTYNVAEDRLYADTTSVSVSGYTDLDIISNGFKFRRSSGAFNATGNTSIYIAFAESPFKTSNAR